MKKLKFIIISALFFTNSCVNIYQIKSNKCQDINQIRSLILSENDKMKNYNKKINNSVALKISNNNNYKIDCLLNPKAFKMVSKLEIKSEADVVDFTKFFSEEDFKYMKCQYQSNKIKSWSEVIDNDSINKDDGIYYSIPFFNKKGNYALVYREHLNSGDVLILKRNKDQWTDYALGFIWRAD